MLTRRERAELRAALPDQPETLTAAFLNSRDSIQEYKEHRHALLDGLTTPAYVNSDATCRYGVASLAYTGEAIGERVEIIRCDNSTLAEFLALLMAMEDAETFGLPGPVEYRLDCTAVANYRTMRTADFRPLRRRLDSLMQMHSNWRLLLIPRRENRIANNLARKALDGWDRTP